MNTSQHRVVTWERGKGYPLLDDQLMDIELFVTRSKDDKFNAMVAEELMDRIKVDEDGDNISELVDGRIYRRSEIDYKWAVEPLRDELAYKWALNHRSMSHRVIKYIKSCENSLRWMLYINNDLDSRKQLVNNLLFHERYAYVWAKYIGDREYLSKGVRSIKWMISWGDAFADQHENMMEKVCAGGVTMGIDWLRVFPEDYEKVVEGIGKKCGYSQMEIEYSLSHNYVNFFIF